MKFHRGLEIEEYGQSQQGREEVNWYSNATYLPALLLIMPDRNYSCSQLDSSNMEALSD